MKKIIILISFCLPLLLLAQIPQISSPAKVIFPWVEIYSQPNFTGNKTVFRGSQTNKDLSIPAPYKISVKVQPGYVAYINTCNEFNDEVMVRGNQNISLTYNCPLNIKIEKEADIFLQFTGITTTVHNNDCRKVFGNIWVKVYELRADGGVINSFIKQINMRDVNNTQPNWLVYTNASSTSTANVSTPNVFNDRPWENPSFPLTITTPVGFGNIASSNFVVGKSAITEGRVRIEVTADLGTAHKKSDFSEYYPNLKMRTKVKITKTLREWSVLSSTTSLPNYTYSAHFGPYTIDRPNPGDLSHDLQVSFLGNW